MLINFSFATNYGHRSPAMLALVNTSYGAGSFVGPALVGVAAGYPQVLAGAGVVGLLCVVPLLRTPDDAPLAVAAPVAVVGVRGLILAFALLLFVYTGIETGVGTWEATDLVASGWSVQGAAVATSVYWGAFTIGRDASAHRLPFASRPNGSSCPHCSIAILLLLGDPSPRHLTAQLRGGGPLRRAGVSVVLSWLARVVPNAPSAMTYAILGAILGSAVLPAVLGGLIGLSGLQILPLGVAAYALACFAMVAFVAVWRRKPEAVSPRPE